MLEYISPETRGPLESHRRSLSAACHTYRTRTASANTSYASRVTTDIRHASEGLEALRLGSAIAAAKEPRAQNAQPASDLTHGWVAEEEGAECH